MQTVKKGLRLANIALTTWLKHVNVCAINHLPIASSTRNDFLPFHASGICIALFVHVIRPSKLSVMLFSVKGMSLPARDAGDESLSLIGRNCSARGAEDWSDSTRHEINALATNGASIAFIPIFDSSENSHVWSPRIHPTAAAD